MKFPLWRQYAMRPLMLRLTPATIATFLGTVGLLASAVGAVGYAVGTKNTEPVKHLVVSQQSTVSTTQPEQQLQAVNQRVAEMQAQLLRLDALTQQMAQSAHVPVQEFTIDPKGAKGGPLLEEMSVLGEDNIDLRLQELSTLIAQKEAQIKALDRILSQKKWQSNLNYLANLPVRQGAITSTYGYRTDPFTGRTAFHAGMDFSGAEGEDIYAVAAGIVSFAGQKSGYGNVIEVTHGDGYITRYAHAQRLAAKEGDMVAKDQVIAYMGSTGRSTGTHLHYEVLVNGKQIDPMTYVSMALKRD
ncbi:MAG TPA: M23 family metallopeptidase [Agitococcus sp.]|uniref:M23 family metallopeptidase n=1 Tax=uncultured Agitococcus sp. TaxID=1506599 RepID=UPI00261E19A9|nr:M23 family metallopeptidase [uncultured Agitococcus sp.]HRH91437.1 M23 family metallopeptidase [Agitococcus sp.]